MNSVELDNRLYILQNSNLDDDLKEKLQKADKLFIEDKDSKAKKLILEIEKECKKRGIDLYDPNDLTML